MNIGLASDHAGYGLKQTVIKWLEEKGHTVKDYGCYSTDSCDYPDYAHPLATAIENNEHDFGIAICSTGNGIAMTMNHHQGIRAALCWDVPLAHFARCHNNANVLCLPANFVSWSNVTEILEEFFSAQFEGGRHQRRIDKIPCK